MIFPGTALFRFVSWIADHFGFDLDLQGDRIMDSLEEEEVVEQLQYGRD